MLRLLALPLALAALLAAAVAPGAAPRADQRDTRLDRLFARLHDTAQPEEAETATREIWRIWRETGDQRADRLMARGLALMFTRDYKGALAAFDELVRLAPGYAEGWNKRATVHYLMDNYDESIKDIVETLRREPRHFGAMSGLGLVYMELGDDELALDAFEKALEINPYLGDAKRYTRELKRKLAGQSI